MPLLFRPARLSIILSLLFCTLLVTPAFTLQAGGTTPAIERYRQALKVDPDNPTLHYILGLAQLKNGFTDEAIASFRAAYPAYTDSIEMHYNMGLAFSQAGDADSALLYLRIAEGLNPYNPRVMEALGYVRHQTGDIQGAFDAWSEAILYDSSVLKTYLNLITVAKELGYKDKFHYYLERVTRRDDAPSAAYVKLAESYIELQQFDSARSVLQRGLKAGLEKAYVRRLVKKYPQLRQ